jgi:hypothetical protein
MIDMFKTENGRNYARNAYHEKISKRLRSVIYCISGFESDTEDEDSLGTRLGQTLLYMDREITPIFREILEP